VEIRRLVEIITSADWAWARTRATAISHGWTPGTSFIGYDWRG
jgi:hypothetical protein